MQWTAEAVLALIALFCTLVLAAFQYVTHIREKAATGEREALIARIKVCEGTCSTASTDVQQAQLAVKGLEGEVHVARAEHRGIAEAVERLTKTIDERVARIEDKVDALLTRHP